MLQLLPLVLYTTKDLVNLLHGHFLACMACNAPQPTKATQNCDKLSADRMAHLLVA